jgi:hypothetical protein
VTKVESEILTALAGISEGMSCKTLYNKCYSADDERAIREAVYKLRNKNLVRELKQRTSTIGNLYVLADTVDLTVKDEDAAIQIINTFGSPEVASNDHCDVNVCDDDFDSIMKGLANIRVNYGKRRVIDDLAIKLQTLNRLAGLFNPDIADVLNDIVNDLESI